MAAARGKRSSREKRWTFFPSFRESVSFCRSKPQHPHQSPLARAHAPRQRPLPQRSGRGAQSGAKRSETLLPLFRGRRGAGRSARADEGVCFQQARLFPSRVAAGDRAGGDAARRVPEPGFPARRTMQTRGNDSRAGRCPILISSQDNTQAGFDLSGFPAYVNSDRFGAWRSLVAHLPWEQGVGRSNRLAPIRASSSGGQSNGLLSRGSGVRVPSGAPHKPRGDCESSERRSGGECSSVGRAADS